MYEMRDFRDHGYLAITQSGINERLTALTVLFAGIRDEARNDWNTISFPGLFSVEKSPGDKDKQDKLSPRLPFSFVVK